VPTLDDLERDWALLAATLPDAASGVRVVQPPSWRGPAAEACAEGLLRAVADLDAAGMSLQHARRLVAAAGRAVS
jgi:hypothetical protein